MTIQLPAGITPRIREVGRIRFGQKVEGKKKDGSTFMRPVSINEFRFTSADEKLLNKLAGIYGGVVVPWQEDGHDEYQLFTTSSAIRVSIPPATGGRESVSVNFERWQGESCQRRCDGETYDGLDKDGQWKRRLGACLCNPSERPLSEFDSKQGDCELKTRVGVILPQLPVQIWRLDTGSIAAASEIPSTVNVCRSALGQNASVDGQLVLSQESKRSPDKDGKMVTSRWVEVSFTPDYSVDEMQQLARGDSPGDLGLIGPGEHAVVDVIGHDVDPGGDDGLGPVATPPATSRQDPPLAKVSDQLLKEIQALLTSIGGDIFNDATRFCVASFGGSDVPTNDIQARRLVQWLEAESEKSGGDTHAGQQVL